MVSLVFSEGRLLSSLTAADPLPTVKASRASASLVEPMVNVWFAPRNLS